MPYYITNKSADCSGWAVVKADGEVLGCHKTKKDAIAQGVAVSLSEDEPFMGERAAVDSLNVGDYVSWNVLDPEILGEIEAVEGQLAIVRVYDYDDGIFVASDKLVIMNVFKLERITKPEMVAEKVEYFDKPVPVPHHLDNPNESMRAANGEKVIIVDIDGTLVVSGRLVQRVYDYVVGLEGSVFIVTGRPESERASTESELRDLGVRWSRLYMNPGSTANSVEYKKQTAEKILETYDVVAAVENNPDALRAYRSLGIDAINPSSISRNESRAINQDAPEYMKSAAEQGLKYYADGLGGDGLTDKTIREAREMANGRVSDDKWVRIAAWIARHLPDLDAPDADPSSENYPSPGVVAHLLWGSGPSKEAANRALEYAQSVVKRIEEQANNRDWVSAANTIVSKLESGDVMTENRDKWLNVAWAIKARIEGGSEEARALGKSETRANHTKIEIREGADGMTFEGYAAVFNSDSQPLPFIERIAPGAFKRSLQGRNEIKLLWNHDAGEPLASVRGGSLRLTEDSYGLKVSATLANTTRGRDVAELIRSGVIDSMSFGFNVIKDSWSADGSIRTLHDVRLFETSLVAFPAYESTAGTTSVREMRDINPDALAESLSKLELGEELDKDQADLIKEIVTKLTVNGDEPDPEPEPNGDLLALKKAKLALLEKVA